MLRKGLYLALAFLVSQLTSLQSSAVKLQERSTLTTSEAFPMLDLSEIQMTFNSLGTKEVGFDQEPEEQTSGNLFGFDAPAEDEVAEDEAAEDEAAELEGEPLVLTTPPTNDALYAAVDESVAVEDSPFELDEDDLFNRIATTNAVSVTSIAVGEPHPNDDGCEDNQGLKLDAAIEEGKAAGEFIAEHKDEILGQIAGLCKLRPQNLPK